MGTARIKWRERERQINKRESDGAIVKTTQQLTVRKRVRGRGKEQQRACKIATAKLNN